MQPLVTILQPMVSMKPIGYNTTTTGVYATIGYNTTTTGFCATISYNTTTNGFYATNWLQY